MSTATAPAVRRLPHGAGAPTRDPTAFRILEWAVGLPVAVALLALTVLRWNVLWELFPDLLVWTVLVAVVDLMPVSYWGRVSLTMSLPILLAAGMTYEPWVAGVVALVGSVDPKEFRRELPTRLALFNRGQIALAVMAASTTFHALGVGVGEWPGALLGGAAALAADVLINLLAILGGRFLSEGMSPVIVLRRLFGNALGQFALGYACFGLLAILMATLYHHERSWGLLAFLVPLTLARQMFAHGQRLKVASEEVLAKGRELLHISERIVEERRDERKRVAASLHDEVLQPLFKVHLMAKVLKQDLDSGRLLDLDEDLPELVGAAEQATEETRRLIKNLRVSGLAAGGLVPTLRLLLDDLSLESSATIDEEIEDFELPPLIQLLVYQVAREALVNAVRHSASKTISVSLSTSGGALRLVVRDDGAGFDVDDVSEDHFGLRLMRERTEGIGGRFVIQSGPQGTCVAATFPTNTGPEMQPGPED